MSLRTYYGVLVKSGKRGWVSVSVRLIVERCLSVSVSMGRVKGGERLECG